jgi:DNA repair photolyase
MISIVKTAKEAGAQFAGYTPLRLPYAVKDLFAEWLTHHFPARKEKVLSFVREMRGGKLNDSNFGSRMRGQGVWSEQMAKMFRIAKRQAKLGDFPKLSITHFRRPRSAQLELL